MRFDVITLLPELVGAVVQSGITGRAAERGIISVVQWNPRDYATDVHRTVDDRGAYRPGFDASIAVRDGATVLVMSLHYGGSLWLPPKAFWAWWESKYSLPRSAQAS